MTSKLKNKNYANKIRHGSPKLQEVLREKCRQRMREKRSHLFSKRRFGLELDSRHVQNTLTEIMRQEFKNLATSSDGGVNFNFKEIEEPLSQEEAIELENEIIQEEEQWIFQEYEKLLQDEMEYLMTQIDNENTEVFCPICQKAVLVEDSDCVRCMSCASKLTGHTLQEMKHLINESVNIHAINCIKVPTFMLIPDNNNRNLYLICHDCSTLALVC